MADPTHSAAALPPVDRPTKMRWGCVVILLLGGGLTLGLIVVVLNSLRSIESPTTAGMQASGIAKAIQLYAQDHDGRFPEGATNSNQAFRKLFPDYMEDERSYFAPGSAWHDAAPTKPPDGNIGTPPDYAQCLERGENHWAYVSGLDIRSPPSLPLIADGFVENQAGIYTNKQHQKGGVSKGARAVVVFADGSTKRIPLSARTHFRVLQPDPKTGNEVDIFTREGGLPEAARVLNPE